MKRTTSIFTCLTVVGATLAALGGCSGKEVVIAKDDSSGLNNGQIDAGTGACGAAACSAGQLCCASGDETCAPTCMSVAKCPVYGRPCKVADAGPLPPCGANDCGPEPPITPGVCKVGEQVSTTCERQSDNTCARKIHCTAALTWYRTCGDPVCNADVDAVCYEVMRNSKEDLRALYPLLTRESRVRHWFSYGRWW